jgi:cell division protein FtsL
MLSLWFMLITFVSLLLPLCCTCDSCMQLMLLQRQHRRLVQEHYLAYQQQQQQGDSSEYSSDQPSSSSSSSKVPKVTAEELQEVDIWDAFFDADLADYAQYLRAAADGHPSVFTTMNPNAPSVIQQQQQQGVAQQKGGANAAHADSSDDDEDSSTNVNLTPQQQQQQQERQELLEARQQLANSAAMLELMPPGILNRPLLLLGSSQLLQLSVMAEGRVEDVVEVLQDFYKLKRLGFRAALQELMEVADEQSVVERF